MKLCVPFDLKEPGDMDLIESPKKISTANDKISIDEIKSKLDECLEKFEERFLIN